MENQPVKKQISIKKKDILNIDNYNKDIECDKIIDTHSKQMDTNIRQISIPIKEKFNTLIEQWKQIPTFKKYESSIFGNIRNFRTHKILKPQKRNSNYVEVCLQTDVNGNESTQKVHRLIAQTWLDNPENKLFVNHIDHNPSNNRLDNLEWATIEENNRKRNLPIKKYNKANGQNKSLWRVSHSDGQNLELYPSLTVASKWVIENGETLVISGVINKISMAIKNSTIYRGFKWKLYDNSSKYTNEIWKVIPTCLIDEKSGYEISTYGRVKDPNGKIREGSYDANGYLETCIGKKNHLKMHRLVAQVYLPNPENKSDVNHIDGIKDNNRLDNLEWTTSLENQVHKVTTGLSNSTKAVVLFDQDGILLKEYVSGADLGRDLKISKPDISCCCNGKIEEISNANQKYIVRFKTDVDRAKELGVSVLTSPILINQQYDDLTSELTVSE